MARFKLFGPLVRVPSAVLNRIQEAILDWKANGAANTMGANLDVDNLTHTQRRVHFSAGLGAINPIPANLDNSIDWRDRVLDIVMWFDPDHDIRPGEVNDQVFALEHTVVSWYTGVGNKALFLSPSVALFVDAGGILQLVKLAGYLHVRVSSNLQIKERS